MKHRLEPVPREDFPIGCHVRLPSGRRGVVEAWVGEESRLAPADRIRVRYLDGDRDTVQLVPKYLQRSDKR